MILNKKSYLLIVAIIVAIAIAAIMITVTENNSVESADTNPLPPRPPPPGEWTRCAMENGNCYVPSFPMKIKYGVGSHWIEKNFTSYAMFFISCNDTNFGDPAVGQPKACYTN